LEEPVIADPKPKEAPLAPRFKSKKVSIEEPKPAELPDVKPISFDPIPNQ
jgi:hypothetical protein